MHDWIALDGIRSDSITALVVLDYTPLYLHSRSREETIIPGRLNAITQQAWQQEPGDIAIQLAVVGADQRAVQRIWMEQVQPWLYCATRLTLDDTPQHYYLGSVTGAVHVEALDKWVKVDVTFRANPPCRLRLLTGQDGWFPAADTPIPQQLTAQNATAAQTFTAPGWITLADYCGMENAEIYIAVTGTWQELQLGSFFVREKAETATTIYIDGANDQVYCLEDGVEVNLWGITTGSLPVLDREHKALYVGGTGINVDVKMLVVEVG